MGILSHPHVHASRQEALPAGQAVAGRRFRKTKFGIGCGWTVVPWWYGISSRLVIDASSSSNSQSCRQGKGGVCIGRRAILARPLLPARPDGSWHGIQSARLSARGWASRNLHQLADFALTINPFVLCPRLQSFSRPPIPRWCPVPDPFLYESICCEEILFALTGVA